jgi:hypothetical protein
MRFMQSLGLQIERRESAVHRLPSQCHLYVDGLALRRRSLLERVIVMFLMFGRNIQTFDWKSIVRHL